MNWSKAISAATFTCAGALLLTQAPASAATYLSQSGFGEIDNGFSSCKTASTTGAFATGTRIGESAYAPGGCVGAFTVAIDTAAKTITLAGFESGNYETGVLDITGITGQTITGLTTLSYADLFDPTFYGDPLYEGVPAPLLSYTGDSIHIVFTTFGETPPQFTYSNSLGAAIFSYASVADAVPEPATWGMMIAGFGMVGAALRRRTRVLARA